MKRLLPFLLLLTGSLYLPAQTRLVVNADLPCATPEALRRLAAAGLALVEARDGTTNALSLPDPRLFAPLYGPASADRFRAHAPFSTIRMSAGLRPETKRPSSLRACKKACT